MKRATVVQKFIEFWTESLQAAHVEVPDGDPDSIHSVAFETGLQDLVEV
jgi:hypothetical protein